MQSDTEDKDKPNSRDRRPLTFGSIRAVLESRRNALRRFGEFVFISVVTAVICVTGAAAILNVVSHGWTTEAAAWVQASGTILAVAGAAWLSRGEARRARRWRRQQGEEAAWSVRFVLSQAQLDAHIVAAELTNPEKPFEAFDVRSWRQRTANASLALRAMLARTDYVHAAVVLTLCNAKILVDQLSSDLETLEESLKLDMPVDDQIVADVVYAHINLSELIDQYDARVRGIRQALDRGCDMLPLDEFVDWGNDTKSARGERSELGTTPNQKR